MNTHSQIMCLHDGNAVDVTLEASTFRSPATWLTEALTGGQSSDAGVTVNGYTTLMHGPLWQGVNIIAGDIGQVPIRLVRNEFTNQPRHPAWRLLRVEPNALQRPSVFKETIMQWALVWGNFVGWIIRQGARPVEIIPLRPDCLWPELIDFEGQQIMLYHYISPLLGRQITLLPDDVIHIQGLTGDGVWGYPLWQIAKNTIGHGLALQKHGNKQFSNGAMPSGVLSHPAKMNPEARANLREEWYAVHGGAANRGKIAILWEGMKFEPMSMTNTDAQWLEAVKFDVYQAARLLNLPPHRLGAMEDSSVRANLEEQNEVYKQMTLTRWANRLDEEFRRKLLTVREWESDEYRFVFDWDAFLRADVDTRSTIADRLTKATIWNPNEARRFMGYAPREGGEVYGNPAINPNEPARDSGQQQEESEGEEEQGDETPRNNAKQAFLELLTDQLANLFEQEARHLVNASHGKLPDDTKNFIEFLDGFYGGQNGNRWMGLYDAICKKSVAAAAESGLKVAHLPELARSWAVKRRESLLEACDRVTPDGLAVAVKDFVATPPQERARLLIQLVLNGEGN